MNPITWVTGQFEAKGETGDVSWELGARQEDESDVEGQRWGWYVNAATISMQVEADGLAPDEVTAKRSAMEALQRILYGFCTKEPEDWARALSMLLGAVEVQDQTGVNIKSACSRAREVLKTVPKMPGVGPIAPAEQKEKVH